MVSFTPLPLPVIPCHWLRAGIGNLEALALVWTAKHFRAYLLGQPCIVYTDHAPLQAMFKARHSSGKLARWAGVIAELDLDIRYRPGRIYANADTLSRSPLPRHKNEPDVLQRGDAGDRRAGHTN